MTLTMQLDGAQTCNISLKYACIKGAYIKSTSDGSAYISNINTIEHLEIYL